MTTNSSVATVAASQQDHHHPTFDPSRISAFVSSRNNRFHLDLSNHSLIGVLEAYATYKRRSSPRFANSAVIAAIESLKESIATVDKDFDDLMPIDVTDIFYDEFRQFLVSRKSARGSAIKPSTIRNYFDNIRAALSWGATHRCPVSESYKNYSVERYERYKVALSPSQIAHIYYFDIENNKQKIKEALESYPVRGFSFRNLTKVRDQFVFECNTAQRYSDASRISADNFNDTKTVMQCTQQKTGQHAKVVIPTYAIDTKITYEILDKYGYTAPAYGIAIGNFNRLLHLLLQAIGGEFTKTVSCENRIGGEIVKDVTPLWKLISSHTARRTFVTYHLRRGKNLLQIQRCTGHSDLRSLQAYCILDDND